MIAKLNGGVLITGNHDINHAQFLARKSALKLEIEGLKFKGGSIYALCKRAYELKGARQKVLDQMQTYADNFIFKRKVQTDAY